MSNVCCLINRLGSAGSTVKRKLFYVRSSKYLLITFNTNRQGRGRPLVLDIDNFKGTMGAWHREHPDRGLGL